MLCFECQSERDEEEARIKALEINREKLLKQSQNLISAIEQGIITEQTKFRLKELETEISACDIQ